MVIERRRVVLYGSSVFMAGLEASLRQQPALDVERVDISRESADEELGSRRPSVVIFDLTSPQALAFPLQSLIALLRERVDLSLIGLDPNSATAIVLSGRQHPVLSAEDLQALLTT